MAETTATLPIDALLAPIPGDDPRGEDLWRAEIKDKFDEARKEVVLFDKGAFTTARGRVETPGKWPLIIREAQDYLTGRTKDLYVVARLVEAQLRHRDTQRNYKPLDGLADGLCLARRLIEEAWDRLYPAVEDGDVEVRATPVSWLGDDERPSSLPLLLRSVPLVGDYWYVDFNPSSLAAGAAIDKAAEERRKAAGVAAGAAGAKHWGPVAASLGRILEEVRLLDDALVARMGADLAPSLRGLRNAANDCLDLARGYLPKLDAAPAEAAPAQDAPPGAAPTAAATPAAPTRADLYQRLADTAARLQAIEPHSPIPYLVQRAVELGGMPFPQLMKALIADAKVLDELNRGLGIRAEPPSK